MVRSAWFGAVGAGLFLLASATGCTCGTPAAGPDAGIPDGSIEPGDAGPTSCTADGDCSFGQVCSSGLCQTYRPPDGGTPMGCVADSDCADDQRCAPGSGECVIVPDALPPPDREGAVCLDDALRTCGSSKVGICRLGSEVCTGGQWSGKCVGDIGPQAESCNTLDDDCDGSTDEGFDADGDGYLICAGDCDDGEPLVNPGALESCNGVDDDCDAATDEGTSPQCEDADLCNGVETCSAGACVSGAAVDCSALDGPCTVGVCDGATGLCRAEPITDGTPCDDGNLCTLATTCTAGLCGGGSPPDCSGTSDGCNLGVCDPATGGCLPQPVTDGTLCSDGLFCTAVDLCQAGACGGGGSPDCSGQSDACNLGFCDPTTDSCQPAPVTDGTSCSDGQACTVSDSCQVGVCQPGAAPDCSSLDGPCTAGQCDGATGSCQAVAILEGQTCDDGDPCTLTTTCAAGACGGGAPLDCSGTSDACNAGVCNPVSGICEPQPLTDGTVCDDGTFCTAADSCLAGSCVGSGARDCSGQSDACNLGFCDPATDSCEPGPVADGIACSDGQACTVSDSCQAGACQPGAGPDCSSLDGPCSVGQCDPASGACQAVAILEGLACDDGDPCTVATTCGVGACTGGGPLDCGGAGDACNAGVCNPVSGACEPQPLTDGTACDDGAFCTVVDSCQAGACVGAGVRDCSGLGDACNLGSCDAAASAGAGACVTTPRLDGTACEDGLFCTTTDSCQSGSCQGGSPRDCSASGGSCRTGACDEAARACTGTPVTDGTVCDDGAFCSVGDSCFAGSCQGGGPRDCSALDGACNTGQCNDSSDLCEATPRSDGTLCSDGLYCTVGDSCQTGACQGGGGRDCTGLSDACNLGLCDEGAGACGAQPRADGTACDDGAFCTLGDSCQAGSCQPGGGRDCSSLTDACNLGQCNDTSNTCEAAPVIDGTGCDDGAFCTIADSCQSGSCQGGGARDCSGLADQCNAGVCDETGDACLPQSVADGTVCSDGFYCTVGDSCTGGSCGGAPRDCSGLTGACNLGLCDEAGGSCQASPRADGTLCSDGLYCTVGDSCQSGGCQAGAPRDCSAISDACNLGHCDDISNACEAAPVVDGTGCDDGAFCTVVDSCQAGSCEGGGARDCSGLGDACNTGVCDEPGDACLAQSVADGTVCGDGLYCTVGDSCTGGSCAGAPRDCGGLADQCNAGVCDEAGGQCQAAPLSDGTGCDDGLYCTTGDLCLTGGCQGGAARDCSGQSDACNLGSCNDGIDVCEATPVADGTGCNDGLYCTTADACLAGGCQGGAARDCSALDQACELGVCKENKNRCEADDLPNGTTCDDGLYCNSGESCDRGSCTGGTAVDCSGLGDQCNAGVCDEASDVCAVSVEPDGTLCDDGLYCSASDSCGGGSCGGVARDCSGVTGGDPCYDGSCDEGLSSCIAVDNGTCQGCGAAGAPVADAGPDQSDVPNTVIQLDGSASADPGGQALTYAWALTLPAGSSATLSDPTAVDPTFLGDVGDTFTACLTVTDPEGCTATDCVDIVITPVVRLFIELTWDTDTTDADLHYRAPNGTFFESVYTGGACGFDEGSDCYYSEKNPDWGLSGEGVPDGDCGNDPLLDVDDTDGFGPENVHHDVLWDGAGDFRVGVHYYRAGSMGSTTARVRIHVDGVMVFEAFQALDCDDFWEVADVTVSGGGTTVSVSGLNRPIKAANEGSCL